VNNLVGTCMKARSEGADFPTVWNTILKSHRLVAGPPVQATRDGEPELRIRLITGHDLVFRSDSYSIE